MQGRRYLRNYFFEKQDKIRKKKPWNRKPKLSSPTIMKTTTENLTTTTTTDAEVEKFFFFS